MDYAATVATADERLLAWPENLFAGSSIPALYPKHLHAICISRWKQAVQVIRKPPGGPIGLIAFCTTRLGGTPAYGWRLF